MSDPPDAVLSGDVDHCSDCCPVKQHEQQQQRRPTRPSAGEHSHVPRMMVLAAAARKESTLQTWRGLDERVPPRKDTRCSRKGWLRFGRCRRRRSSAVEVRVAFWLCFLCSGLGTDSTSAPCAGRASVRVHAHSSRREVLLGAAALAPALVLPRTAVAAGEMSFYDFTVQYKGAPFALSAFKDKVTVVVNVASE